MDTLQHVQAPLNGSITILCISHSSQFEIINTLGEGAHCSLMAKCIGSSMNP